jgi:hypothetical protein
MGAIALGSSGCSDPVLPTPQGAWLVQFKDPGQDCSIAGHAANVGQVDAQTRTDVVIDGQNEATVSCTVSGSSSFSVDATASQNGKALQIVIDSISPSATIDNPAKGRVGFTSPNTVKTYIGDKDHPCDFYFKNKSETVASGKIWVAFNCPEVIAEGQDTCQLNESYAIFENCTQ